MTTSNYGTVLCCDCDGLIKRPDQSKRGKCHELFHCGASSNYTRKNEIKRQRKCDQENRFQRKSTQTAAESGMSKEIKRARFSFQSWNASTAVVVVRLSALPLHCVFDYIFNSCRCLFCFASSFRLFLPQCNPL